MKDCKNILQKDTKEVIITISCTCFPRNQWWQQPTDLCPDGSTSAGDDASDLGTPGVAPGTSRPLPAAGGQVHDAAGLLPPAAGKRARHGGVQQERTAETHDQQDTQGPCELWPVGLMLTKDTSTVCLVRFLMSDIFVCKVDNGW